MDNKKDGQEEQPRTAPLEGDTHLRVGLSDIKVYLPHPSIFLDN